MSRSGPAQRPAEQVESFPPIWSDDVRILVLGSMPSTESLRAHEYYAHPRNLFWSVVEAAFGIRRALPYDQRSRALLGCRVGLWDAARRCRRVGSLDATIRAVEPNDVAGLVCCAQDLAVILCNGLKAFELLARLGGVEDVPIRRMPSTSPANAGTPPAEKLRIWTTAFREADPSPTEAAPS